MPAGNPWAKCSNVPRKLCTYEIGLTFRPYKTSMVCMTNTSKTHRFMVTTNRGNVTEFVLAGSFKQARAKLAMKLMRYRTSIAPEFVTSVKAVADAG